MRGVVNVFGLSAALLVLAATSAHAEGSGQEGADRFVPSFVLTSGVLMQDWRAEAESRICRDCNLGGPSGPLRDAPSGSDLDVTPFVGARLEVMAPELPLPGSPRLFLGGEFAANFGFERKLAQEGNAGQIGNPLRSGANIPFSDEIAAGQGTETVAQLEPFTFGAHAGVAFPLELFGRQLRLRTMVSWIHYQISVEGALSDAECRELQNRNECSTQFLPDVDPMTGEVTTGYLRAVNLGGDVVESFHGVGPGVALELDTGRIGPFGSSIFVDYRAYHILGDREVEFDSPGESVSDVLTMPGGIDEIQTSFRFEVPRWIHRAGVGFRLQWLGFDDR